TIKGVPTDDGRRILQAYAGRPQVQALLQYLPAAQAPVPCSPLVPNAPDPCPILNGTPVPIGSLSGSTSIRFNNWQWSTHLDHNFTENHILRGRYLYNDEDRRGEGQATPPGLSTINPFRQQLSSVSFTSTLSPRMLNEVRVGWQRLGTFTN